MSDESQKALTLPKVGRWTEGIARCLHERLSHHLGVLWPLLAPERLLGKIAGGKADPPGVVHLSADLRGEIRTGLSPGPGEGPPVTVTSCLPSFHPADDLIIEARGCSGVPMLIELPDLDTERNITGRVRQRIGPMLKKGHR